MMSLFFIKNKSLILFIVLNLIFLSVSGQHDEHEHQHLHDFHKYHLGFGVAGAHVLSTNGISPGFHLHLLRQLGDERNWGIGLGYEAIVEENLHNGINLLANWHPVDFLSLNAGPGFTFGNHDEKIEVSPAFHTEVVFEFNVGNIHIGPMAGFGIDKEESHFSLGVHVGFGF
jgi:hypothetical protein